MKKALLIGVSGAAMVFAAQAFASGSVSQGQDFSSANVQGQRSANQANGGSGGDGGTAGSRSSQLQGQAVTGSQTQTVTLPDITVNVAPATAGAGISGVAGDGGNSIAAGSTGNSQQSPVQTGVTDAAQASFRSRAAADIAGPAILGDNVDYYSHNLTMSNATSMNAGNTTGAISLSSGPANGGAATGGNLTPSQTALTGNLGRGGDAVSVNADTHSGNGGTGGNATALSANLGLQGALSGNRSDGGDGRAASASLGASRSGAAGLSAAGALAGNLGAALTDDGRARNHQDAASWAKAWSQPIAKSSTDVRSAALGTGGDGGKIDSTTANLADQKSKSVANGGNGGASGTTTASATSTGGALDQRASSGQIINAATGGTQGGNGGDTSVHFATGNIGAISLGTMSGIANIAQNTGLTANQFSSFSINAHSNF